MELKDTCAMMTSPDYKERFRAEYFQLKNRIQGLSAMLKKYKAGALPFTPTCSYELLYSQLYTMTLYLSCLEERARIEEIDLN